MAAKLYDTIVRDGGNVSGAAERRLLSFELNWGVGRVAAAKRGENSSGRACLHAIETRHLTMGEYENTIYQTSAETHTLHVERTGLFRTDLENSITTQIVRSGRFLRCPGCRQLIDRDMLARHAAGGFWQ